MEVLPILDQHNVKKYVGIPDCLTMTGTSYKKCFKYDGIPLTELMNENALSCCECTWFNFVHSKYY